MVKSSGCQRTRGRGDSTACPAFFLKPEGHVSPRGHQRGAGGGGCTASPWRRLSGLHCAADMSGLITPAPVVRATEARRRGPHVSFSWPAGQAEAARPLMGAQSEHPQEKQVLEGLSVAVAVAHPLRARVNHPPPQLPGSSVVSQAAQSSWSWRPCFCPDQPASQTGLCLWGAPSLGPPVWSGWLLPI